MEKNNPPIDILMRKAKASLDYYSCYHYPVVVGISAGLLCLLIAELAGI